MKTTMMNLSCIRVIKCCIAIITLSQLAGCATTPPEPLAKQTRSIVILPPKNATDKLYASHMLLRQTSKPLAEHGYYVFPVAIVERFMQENGLHTADQMHEVDPAKFKEQLGADAVMYVTINDWGISWNADYSVKTTLNLVDTQTGESLWEKKANYTQPSNNQAGLVGLIALLIFNQLFEGDSLDRANATSRAAFAHGVFKLPIGERLAEHQQKMAAKS